jgi:glycosyltransferase involved in cell wall biosynthesis
MTVSPEIRTLRSPSAADVTAYPIDFGSVPSVGRVLLITDTFVPTTTSTAKLVYDLAVELARRKLAITILVPSATTDKPCEVSIEDGLEVIRIKTSRTKGAGKVLRGLREVSFSQQIWRRAKQVLSSRSFDLIIFFSPTIFFGTLVERLKERFGCPAYLVLRDLWTQFMLDVGELRPGLAYKYLLRFEQKQYCAADVIGVQSPGDLRYFDDLSLASSPKIEVLFNWYAAPRAAPSRTGYRERFGLENRIVFFFGGNFGVAQDPLNVLRLASALRGYSHVHFFLVGWGSQLPEMRSIISNRDLSNVTLLDTVPQDEFISMVSEFDVGLISLDRRFKINNVPGRLMAYLYGGLPVLASVNPRNDLFAILNQNGVGYCCTNGDDDLLQEYALALASDAALRVTLGQRGRALLGNLFSPQHAADQVLRNFSLGDASDPTNHKYKRQIGS